MTKKEIALTLARQYAEIENKMWAMDNKAHDNRKEHGRESKEYKYYKVQAVQLKSCMNTILESKELLGINKNTWLHAIESAYIENSKKEQSA